MCFRAQVAVSSAVPADMILSSAWFLLERQRETPKPTLFIIPAVQQEVKPKFADYLIYILFSLVFSLALSKNLKIIFNIGQEIFIDMSDNVVYYVEEISYNKFAAESNHLLDRGEVDF